MCLLKKRLSTLDQFRISWYGLLSKYIRLTIFVMSSRTPCAVIIDPSLGNFVSGNATLQLASILLQKQTIFFTFGSANDLNSKK